MSNPSLNCDQVDDKSAIGTCICFHEAGDEVAGRKNVDGREAQVVVGLRSAIV